MKKDIEEKLNIVANNFLALKNISTEIEEVANACIASIQNGGKIIFMGNGGSASDAEHMASELVGRYKLNRRPLPAISISSNCSNITSLGNDFGFSAIFERQVVALGKKEDVIIAISTSGKSENIISTLKTAKDMGIKTVLLTGDFNSDAKKIADLSICAPSKITNNIQEMHIAIGHILCDIIEKTLCDN